MIKFINVFANSFFISFLLNYLFIIFANKFNLFQPFRSFVPGAGTKLPIFGGIAMFISIFASQLGANSFNWPIFLISFSYFCLGLWDDLDKLMKNHYVGLSKKFRILIEVVFALLFAFFLNCNYEIRSYIPFIGESFILSVILGALVVLSTANAANLTDGMDALAASQFLLLFLFLPKDSVSIASIAAICAYLIFNFPPAKIIMGDAGAKGIGALIGALYYYYGLEFYLIFCGLIMIVETISVMIQIYYILYLKSKLFLMSPIHFHFQLLGYSKKSILTSFFLITLLICLICSYLFNNYKIFQPIVYEKMFYEGIKIL